MVFCLLWFFQLGWRHWGCDTSLPFLGPLASSAGFREFSTSETLRFHLNYFFLAKAKQKPAVPQPAPCPSSPGQHRPHPLQDTSSFESSGAAAMKSRERRGSGGDLEAPGMQRGQASSSSMIPRPTAMLMDPRPTAMLMDPCPMMMLLESRPTAMLMDQHPTVMLMDPRPTAMLMRPCPAATLMDQHPTAMPRDPPPTAMLLESRPMAMLMDQHPTALRMDPCPMAMPLRPSMSLRRKREPTGIHHEYPRHPAVLPRSAAPRTHPVTGTVEEEPGHQQPSPKPP